MLSLFTTQSSRDSGERIVNGFLRAARGKAASARILGRSGLLRGHYFGTGQVRALVVHQDKLYVAASNALWRLDSAPVYIAPLPDGVTRMVSGATQVAIVVESSYYVFDSGAGTVTAVTPGVITSVVDVCQIDGYFFVMGTGNGRNDCMQQSALDDATTFNALDYAFTETSEDGIVGCVVDHGEVWVFGTQTTEKFYNSGEGFVLTRNPSTFLEHGCIERETIAKADNRVFWVGEDRIVYAGSGAEATVISARWVEDRLQKIPVEGAFVFKDRGAPMYCIRITGYPAMVYDITTGLWHERSTFEGGEWIGTCRATYVGFDWIGTTTGAICSFNEDAFADDSYPFTFEAISAPLVESDRFRIKRLQIIFGGGGIGIDRTPKVMLRVSKNGQTWGRERWRNLSTVGEYFKPVTWRSLGMSRYWQARIRITDQVNRDIEGVFYE